MLNVRDEKQIINPLLLEVELLAFANKWETKGAYWSKVFGSTKLKGSDAKKYGIFLSAITSVLVSDKRYPKIRGTGFESIIPRVIIKLLPLLTYSNLGEIINSLYIYAQSFPIVFKETDFVSKDYIDYKGMVVRKFCLAKLKEHGPKS